MNPDRRSGRRRSELIRQVERHIGRARLGEILAMMVNIPSPTGEEAALARAIVDHCRQAGIPAVEQRLDDRQSNAVATLAGTQAGPPLLLYSPIDTMTSNSPEEDLPWAAATMRQDLKAKAIFQGDHIIGLGAQNPKGHAACVLAAGEALAQAGIQLDRQVLLGFGAGGMPTNARPGTRENSGHGAGCDHLVGQLPAPLSAAVIAKSGWTVSWEEVGFAWFSIRVGGTHTYVGSRHLMPYVNSIAAAGKLIAVLEDWFPKWSEQYRSGLVAPQGVVSQVNAGWPRMPAFTPAECHFQVDLRIGPRTGIEEVDERFFAAVQGLAESLGVTARCARTLYIPGTSTEPGARIVRECIGAWEELEGRAHQPMTGMSGATDANILRMHGIPTARIGLPKADIPGLDFALGMNAASLPAMEKLTRHLVRTAIRMCVDEESR